MKLLTFKEWLVEDAKSPDTEKLKSMLKDFDVYFPYADDYRAWKRGSEQQEKILKMVKKMGKSGEQMYKNFMKQHEHGG